MIPYNTVHLGGLPVLNMNCYSCRGEKGKHNKGHGRFHDTLTTKNKEVL